MNTKEIFEKHKKRLVAEGIANSALAGGAIGFGINLILSVVYWMTGFGSIWLYLAIGVLSAVAAGAVIYLLRYRVSDMAVARRIDACGERERMITMLEFSADDSTVARIQREDAAARLAGFSADNIKYKIPLVSVICAAAILVTSLFMTTVGALAELGQIPYGRDLIAGGVGSFDVVYSTSGGGSLVGGDAEQSVEPGGSTERVRAVADNGWIFVRWDDGNVSPERMEERVASDMVITAIFERIDSADPDDDDSDSADDLPYGSAIEESGGGGTNDPGGETPKDDVQGQGTSKWQDRNQFIDGATYYRDYLEVYYQYATGIFESNTDIPDEIIEFFETYFSGI